MRIADFKLERFFAKHEFTAKYLLCSSDCESISIGELLEFEPDAHSRFLKEGLGYTESLGNPNLRKAIAGIYTNMGPDNILVHAGAEEVIFNCMNTILNRGDHVVVQCPCYQSHTEVARAIGCDVSEVIAREENNWELDSKDFQRALRPNTKLIIISSPHNPTGSMMSLSTFRDVLALAEENGAYVLSDEVYRELEHDPASRLPAACDISTRAISVGVMSKAYGLPGLRIGWLASGDADIYRKVATFKDYTTICSSGPSEFLATLALRHRERLLARNLELIGENLNFLDRFFSTFPELFKWQRPSGGSTAFPLYRGQDSVTAFCEGILRDTGVLLLPGSLFGDGFPNFRIGYGRKNMKECIGILAHHLSKREVTPQRFPSGPADTTE